MAVVGVNKQDVLRLLALQASNGEYLNTEDTYMINGFPYSYDPDSNEFVRIPPVGKYEVSYDPAADRFAAAGQEFNVVTTDQP